MSLFQPIELQSKEQAQAPIAARLAAFKTHKQNLLAILRNVHSQHSGPFDEGKFWRDLCKLAEFYFWCELGNTTTMPSAERRERLRQLTAALRRARGLTDRALKDDVGDVLYRAFCAEEGIGLHSDIAIDNDGSSVLTRLVDEIKEMARALGRLEKAASAAAARNKPNKGGRPTRFPRECIQRLANVYCSTTGSRPGRGNGPFANFASAFFIAAGQTGFSRASLIDAIQEAHRRLKPSWFDGKPPHF